MYAYEGELTPGNAGVLLYRFANQNYPDPLMPGEYIGQVCAWLHTNHPDYARQFASDWERFWVGEMCAAAHDNLPAEEASAHKAAAERTWHIVQWLTLDVGAPLPDSPPCVHGESFRVQMSPEEALEVGTLLRKFVDGDPDPTATPEIAKVGCQWLRVNFPDFAAEQAGLYNKLCTDNQCRAAHTPVSEPEQQALLQTAIRARAIVNWLVGAGVPAPLPARCEHGMEG
jgi:hypothetical protein